MAIGLGIGGALASIPGTASADSSDWLTAVDSFLSGAAVPAATEPSSLNLAISFDGMSLFQDGSAYAYSGSGGDIAIANGAGATAYAFGTNNYASVDGTDSTAIAGGINAGTAGSSADNTAFVFGDNDYGLAGTTDSANPGSFDYSVIFGNGDKAYSGGDAAGAGSYDGAYVEGNNLGTAYAQGGDYLADILKFYGDGTTTSAAAATDLLPGVDASGALADGSGAWADLLSSFDGGSLAADASNFWTELATLF
jgi:hypothetical protein